MLCVIEWVLDLDECHLKEQAEPDYCISVHLESESFYRRKIGTRDAGIVIDGSGLNQTICRLARVKCE